MHDDDAEPIKRDDAIAILREAVEGRSARQIAEARGLTTQEVNRVLDREAAEMLSGEGTRRMIAVESERLNQMKQKLWNRYMTDGDNASAALFIKASERHASMLGHNHPAGHVVQVIGHLSHSTTGPTTTQSMLETVRALRGEAPPEK